MTAVTPLIKADFDQFEFGPYRLTQRTDTEIRCIRLGHSTIQGKVINTLADGRVVIKHKGIIYSGKPVPQYVRGS